MFRHRSPLTLLIVVFVAISSLFSSVFVLPQAHAASLSLPDQVRVGIHNTYDKSKFAYLLNALDTGTGLIEIDIWQDFLFSGKYHVSHDPIGNNNNCETATSYGQLGHQDRNQDFSSCLEDIRLWSLHNPDHPPLILKIEMKNGFVPSLGFGPSRFDAQLATYLGSDIIYKPADLMGNTYADLDSAARANAWPSADQLRGKVIVVIQRGTVESDIKFHYSDQQYIDYLVSLKKAGKLSQAMAFPTYLGAAAGDPRPANRKAWYIVFGGDASTYAALNTSFYYKNHYLVIMTDAQNVSPAISDTNPSVSNADNRVNQLAAHGATIVSSDWTNPKIDSYTAKRSYAG
jgi:hypothetical protein